MVARAHESVTVGYALAGEQALRLRHALRDASNGQLEEVERAAPDYCGDEVDAIGRDELITSLRAGDVWPEWRLTDESRAKRRAAA